MPVDELDINLTEFINELEGEFVKERGTFYVTKAEGREECVLVIVVFPRKPKNVEERIADSRTSPIRSACRSLTRSFRDPRSLHAKFLVGQGKIEEIAMKSRQLGAGMLVFDEELTPSR